MIQFDLKIPLRKTTIRIRSFKDCDWGEFSKMLTAAIKAIPIPKIFTVSELEKHANLFHSTIISILDKIQPKRKIFNTPHINGGQMNFTPLEER
jgi:hypothetical protein